MITQATRKLLFVAALLGNAVACSDPVHWAPETNRHDPQVRPEQKTDPLSEPARYAGSHRCQQCHAGEFEQWRSSHHALAMQTATANSVLGDFSAPAFTSHGERFEFRRQQNRFQVTTANTAGEQQDFTISHSFGVHPLQQYLVEFPNGAKQVLPVSWDSRPAVEGGQRWFHIYPQEAIPPGDPLHWTGIQQNWNHQCADCHTTDFRKAYASDSQAYHSQFSEATVGCEACHGPASNHIAWANTASNAGSSGANSGFTVDLSRPATLLSTCAKCHSRREQIAEGFKPGDNFLDYYTPALLENGLYHADGQVNAEVYVYGSFLQSRMHQAGVVCSDCHQPHSASLIATGDAVCTQCHSPQGAARFEGLQAKNYTARQHHFHPPDSAGARCRNCHMPAKTFMVSDLRRDHSFRIPRPDISAQYDTPNVCTDCHKEQSLDWANSVLQQRGAKQSAANFAGALNSAWRNQQGATAQLLEVVNTPEQPDIVVASALAALSGGQTGGRQAIRNALQSSSPLRQLGALRALSAWPLAERWQLAAPLLNANTRSVRNEAGRLLADAPPSFLNAADSQRLQAALDSYRMAQQLNADRPEAWSNLALLKQRQGHLAAGIADLNRAIALAPDWLPAYLNRADFQRQLGDEDAAKKTLQAALNHQPDNPQLLHSLGLLYSRTGQSPLGLSYLERAAEAGREDWWLRYVYAIALNSNGATKASVKELLHCLQLAPEHPEVLYALATIHRDQGETREALAYARRLNSASPGEQRGLQLIRALREPEMK